MHANGSVVWHAGELAAASLSHVKKQTKVLKTILSANQPQWVKPRVGYRY